MPDIAINGVKLHYTDEGSGAEVIVFSHGLLLDHSIFAAQINHLKSRYRCIAYDHRGQGLSERTHDGFDMDCVTDDAAHLIEQLGVRPCHFVGHSMGGFVGLRLAIKRPELIKSLLLINSSAAAETLSKIWQYRLLNVIARRFGLEIVADRAMPIMFGRAFMQDPARDDERRKWRALVLDNDPVAITRAVSGVITQSAQLLDAYLDRTEKDWRQKAGLGTAEGAAEDPGQGSTPTAMTRDEALEILGLKAGTSADAIHRAHRTLMKKLHPDQGGSTYLAAKINQAKDVLLG